MTFGSHKGRIPSCLNEPSSFQVSIHVPWLLCIKCQHIYVEIQDLSFKHYYKSSEVSTRSKCNFLWDRSTFRSKFTFSDFTCWMQYHHHVYLNAFLLWHKKIFFFNPTANSDLQVIRRPKFPSELEGLHHERCGGEGELLFSCRTNTVLYRLAEFPALGCSAHTISSIQLQPERITLDPEKEAHC